MPMTFKARCICEWVQESNGIVKAAFQAPFSMPEEQQNAILVNTPREFGVPKIGETYFIDIQPAFPHG